MPRKKTGTTPDVLDAIAARINAGTATPDDADTLRAQAEAMRPKPRPRKDWEPDPKVTLPMWTFPSVWRRAEQRADSETRTRAQAIDEGFNAFLAGRFVPRKPARGSVGGDEGEKRQTVNTRIAEARAEEIAAFVAAHSEVLGWSPSPAQVAAAWLEQEYAPAPTE